MRFSGMVSAALLLATAAAWNTDVHIQIARIAETLLTPGTVSAVRRLLEPKYNGSIGLAASWADEYRRLPEGAFSTQWHWIDSSDQPPAYCNTYFNRDCTKGGCLVSAIANQTEILKGCIASLKHSTPNGSNLTCSYALKWVVHFMSDITQPLHISGIGAGGNAFNVIFGNRSTVLHSIWDGAIIYADAGVPSFPNGTLQPFFSDLVTRITRDQFFEPVAQWTACADVSTPLRCALEWATDSNKWNCDYVYSQIFNGTDLLTSGYAEGAYPIVELQMAKAAKRLSVWLNTLVDGRYKKDRGVVLQTNPSWALGASGGI